jgi:CheY-like chemotaxis protein/two-component sensor histidine kinase
MSHELRTPMNAVIGYSEMLEEEAVEQELDDFIPDLQKIRTSGRHLLKLINDVLDLSKIEADKLEIYPEVVDVDNLVEEIEAGVRPLINENNNQLKLISEVRIGEIFVDATKLRQVILNLLSNAAKFTDSGVIQFTMKRVMEDDGEWLAIDVEDSGIGMSEDQMTRLFEPFSQADASTTRHYGGTGLGMTISKRFCEMMGGSLSAKSELGTGTTFLVRIPIQTVPEEAQESVAAAASVPESADTGTDPASTVPTVLVIDDDEVIRDLMQRLLGREGYRVVTAADGEEGLRLAGELMPAVITLDVLMPGPDGWSVLSKLKADPKLAGIPVIMQTIVDEPREAFTMGVAEYLSKPIDRQQLVEVVDRLQKPAKREVLVVEDDIDTRDLIARYLQGDGWTVHTAKDGNEGLREFAEHRPGFVVLDLMMPEIDGFSLLDKLRHDYPDDNVQVIVVTAKDLTTDDRDRLNGFVQRVIHKGDGSMSEIVREIQRNMQA